MDENFKKMVLRKHSNLAGKIEVISRANMKTKEDLSTYYTPGVAAPCLEIEKNSELSYVYTRRKNLVAVVTDGSAVLGLGDIGPLAAMPVMEGKCALFKAFADIDAFPICIASKNVDEIVRTVKLISGSFGGINLEDIAAPRCFEVEEKLKQECDIPVFHDDQHGTAVVVLAALINAAKVVKKDAKTFKILISGAGAAGTAIGKLLIKFGIKNVTFCDKFGILNENSTNLSDEMLKLAKISNPDKISGGMADGIANCDAFIGVSAPNIVTADMVRSMAKNPIVFALANPTPEIDPELAKAAGAAVVGTGRSDLPNQINNVLAFPGIFRGVLDARIRSITDEMKIAASFAISSLITDDELNSNYIIPDPFDKRVVPKIAEAIMKFK